MELTVGIDCRRLRRPGRGIDRFLRVLIGTLPGAAPELRLRLFTTGRQPSLAAELAGSRTAVEPAGLGLRMQYRRGVGPLLRPFLGRLDVFHFPGPDIWHSRRSPAVVNVHDAAPYLFPERFFRDGAEERRFRRHMDRIRANADRIATVSESAAREVGRFLAVEPGRIRTIPDGPDPLFRPLTVSEEERHDLERRLGAGGDYLLFVGGNDFRKNLRGAVLALERLAARRPIACPLLVVGARVEPPLGDDLDSLPAYRRALERGWLRWLGPVSDHDLCLLYRRARLLLFPSLHEGFGYPPIEAMACGTPVIASGRGALGEVIGDAARMVDPEDPEAIADAIALLLADEGARRELAERGLARAARFSPLAMARSYAELYAEIASLA